MEPKVIFISCFENIPLNDPWKLQIVVLTLRARIPRNWKGIFM